MNRHMLRLLPGITTHSDNKLFVKRKLQEIELLNVKEFALFLSGFAKNERARLYADLMVLRKRHRFSIPFVQARNDMTEQELSYLVEQFDTERFSINPTRQYEISEELSPLVKKRLYVRNIQSIAPLSAHDINGFAGVCLDLSHLRESREISYHDYEQTLEIVEKTCVGAYVISAFRQVNPWIDEWTSKHFAEEVEDFSYLSEISFLEDLNLVALKLDNDISDQLAFKASICQRIREHSSELCERLTA